jgi:DNA-binding NarL/FixJ family response regulator
MNDDREITVLVIDEYEEVCRLLARSLESLPGIRVLAHTTNPVKAAELAHELAPQIIIADFKRGAAPRVDMFRWIGRSSPQSRLVIHTSYYTPDEREALQANGFSRCLLKGMSVKDLGAELRNVISGRTAGPVARAETSRRARPPR